jgi:Zn-finger nucleic acid-binding protein
MTTVSESGMRCLVACASCKRQFDAAGFAAGSRFHCACGEMVEVPRFRPHDADVVRCSACSAPRTDGAPACRHCGGDYTLHERDLHTVCPSCMTRVSDRARFCHHCATPIVAQGGVGEATEQSCPACGPKQKLHGRRLGNPPLSVSECGRCVGLWLSAESFRILADRARERTAADSTASTAPPATDGRSAASRNFYRKCPSCSSMMHRRNFGKRSGIVIDACKEHGFWFDAAELDAILQWIRDGGEQRSLQRDAAAARHAERQSRLRVERSAQAEGGALFMPRESRDTSGIGDLLGLLFDL